MERFWSKVDKNGPNGCWVWAGAKVHGYGAITMPKGTTRVAHRLSYMWVNGQVPQGKELDHLCRNRACVNPAHLEAVTRMVNILRGEGIPRKNLEKTHCDQGHAFTPENTYLTPAKARRCRACHNARQKRYNRQEKKHSYMAI